MNTRNPCTFIFFNDMICNVQKRYELPTKLLPQQINGTMIIKQFYVILMNHDRGYASIHRTFFVCFMAGGGGGVGVMYTERYSNPQIHLGPS